MALIFPHGVRDTARDALADTHALTDLHRNYRGMLDSAKRPPAAASGVLDALFGTPLLSISVHAERNGISYQNVAKALAFWQARGVVTETTSRRRNRIFVAPEILKLTRTK